MFNRKHKCDVRLGINFNVYIMNIFVTLNIAQYSSIILLLCLKHNSNAFS